MYQYPYLQPALDMKPNFGLLQLQPEKQMIFCADFVVARVAIFVLEAEFEPKTQAAAHLQADSNTS